MLIDRARSPRSRRAALQKHANALFLEFSAGHSRFLVQDRARGVRYAICALHWDGRAALVHSIREGGSATPLALWG